MRERKIVLQAMESWAGPGNEASGNPHLSLNVTTVMVTWCKTEYVPETESHLV